MGGNKGDIEEGRFGRTSDFKCDKLSLVRGVAWEDGHYFVLIKGRNHTQICSFKTWLWFQGTRVGMGRQVESWVQWRGGAGENSGSGGNSSSGNGAFLMTESTVWPMEGVWDVRKNQGKLLGFWQSN